MPTKQSESAGFESNLKRLEEIVKSMESGTLDLDQMIAAFEEGQKLVKSCTTTLNEVEQRIEIIVKNSQGEMTTEPFTPKN